MVKHSEPKPPLYLRFSWLYAPVLAVIYPVLHMYAASVREADPRDAAVCGIVAVVAAIALAYLLRLFYPDPKRAGFAAVVIIVWCFTFSTYLRLGRMATEVTSSSSSSTTPLKDFILLLLWLLLLLVALWFLFRVRWSEYRSGRVYRLVKFGCLFAVIFAAYQAARGHLQTTDVESPASIWASDREALPETWVPIRPQNPRDVYYLIFDRYGNDPALRKFFQFDNSEFYNELEKRGFAVDRNATCSYPMTMLSM
jgi:hypothetical protein